MLRKSDKNEFLSYVDFFYSLATDLSKSGYPTYCDGVKTKDMFIQSALEAFSRDNEEFLIFEYDNTVQGFIHYFWIEQDHYLQTSGTNINIHPEIALEEFMDLVNTLFEGYDIFLGYPAENIDSINYLKTNGFECIEESINNTAHLEQIAVNPVENIVSVSRDNFELFDTLHCIYDNEEMYWNSQRILDKLDQWRIFVKMEQNNPVGAVYFFDAEDGWYEIFGIDLINQQFHSGHFMDLLLSALYEIKHIGGKIVTLFCENEEEEDVAIRCGFECIGKYKCYKTHID